MTTHDFATAFYTEKEDLLGEYFVPGSALEVADLIRAMGLDEDQTRVLRRVLDGALTDALYTVLLGLDGAAAIGGLQARYELRDEDGGLLTGGDLEGTAYGVFYEQSRG